MPEHSSVLQHRTGPLDTLRTISQARYGTPDMAPAIYHVNRAIIGPDPNRLNPGQLLVLPRVGVLALEGVLSHGGHV